MALSRHHATIPQSVEQIAEHARQFEFGINRPLKSWLRSAQLLLTEAALCEQDGNLQIAYLYLLRHAELVLSKFPQHPQFEDPKLQNDLTQARRTVKRNLLKLEQWKPRVKHEHERYVKGIERRNAERQRVQEQRLQDEHHRRSNDRPYQGSDGSGDEMPDGSLRTLDAYEDSKLAVDLAHQELRRRDATRQSTHQAGISPSIVASRRRGIIMDTDETTGQTYEATDGVSEGVREAGRYLDGQSGQQPRESRLDQRKTASMNYQYPSVPVKEDAMEWRMNPMQPERKTISSAPPPTVPSKELPEDRFVGQNSNAPPRPLKARDSAASKLTFKTKAFTESGAPLRPLLLPPELRRSFLNLAHPNTAHNLETCGILCGTLVSNALAITHLVIPDQNSTSDTCDTTEEGDNALFDFCDSNDLLVCGWIHTHPSQSCFLSSRDLHTSSGYQVMLPEAIAIVCAPRHNPDWGIFRLTEPPGLDHILNCPQRSLFHPHTVANLYTDALEPGHVVEGPGLAFQLVDLRKR